MALKYLSCARHNPAVPLKVRYMAQYKLAELPPATSSNRLSPRCSITFRGKGIIPEFNISRLVYRQRALEGLLHGIQKASW